MLIVWYPLEFINLHPWYWNTLLYSLISSGENSAFALFAAALASHYNLAFSLHQVPIIAGWTEATWYDERLAQHLWPAEWLEHRNQALALLNFSDLKWTGFHSAMCYHQQSNWLTKFFVMLESGAVVWSIHCCILCFCIASMLFVCD